jgi:thiamine-phosphate pyrophosphorylase
MSSLQLPCLMVVTDRTRLTPNWALAQAVAPAITGGANALLMREDDLPLRARLTVARFVADAIRHRARFLLSGPVSSVLSAGADGAHMEEDDAECLVAARQALGPHRLLGAYARDLASARDAEAAGADYLSLHLDWSRPAEAARVVKRFRAESALPLIAGIDPPLEMVGRCMDAGASGIAVCEPAMTSYDRTAALAAFARALGLSG